MVAVSVVAVIVLGVPLGVAVDHLYRNEEILRLERQATVATQSVDATSIGTTDPVELPAAPRGAGLALYSQSGMRIAGRGPARADGVVLRALHGRVREPSATRRPIVAVPIARQETIVAAIRAEAPPGAVTARVHRAWLLMIATGLAAILTATLIGLWLARRLTTPVRALAHDAHRLGDGDFTTRSRRSGVPELDDVAAALDATGDRLGAALERERHFSTDASHQLRTPISAVRLQLESAQLTPGADPNAAIAHALPQLDRLERTVDDLLALARDRHHDLAATDITGVLDELERSWHGRVAGAGRPLVVHADPPIPDVFVSASALRQVLDVLVDNALEHGAGAITVRARPAAHGVAVEVGDEGEGIAGAVEAIWTRGVGRSHGIGLALARTLAEEDGARLVVVRARPRPIFALILPALRPPTHGAV